jgi:hypothetical protein
MVWGREIEAGSLMFAYILWLLGCPLWGRVFLHEHMLVLCFMGRINTAVIVIVIFVNMIDHAGILNCILVPPSEMWIFYI